MQRLTVGFLVVLGSLAGAGPVPAQKPTYTVHGVVKNTDGEAIAGVDVLLEGSTLKGVTNALGRFALDSVPAGNRRLLVRRIGYFPVHPPVSVPQTAGDTLTVLLLQVPQPLPMVEVQADRPGIRGTVGDTAYHALRGTRVELVGATRETTADSMGRFAFENVRPRQYVLRISHPGYQSRMITANLEKKGLEYAIFLKEIRPGGFDWATSKQAGGALFDLGRRLAWEPARNRMTRSELARYGSLALCNIPRLPRVRPGWEIAAIIRNSTVYRVPDLCGWSADQIELLEWGQSPCRENWKSIADLLGVICGPRGAGRFSIDPPTVVPTMYVVLWPRN